MDGKPKWRRTRSLPHLHASDIDAVFKAMLTESDDSPERAVVALMNKYNFSFPMLLLYLEDNLERQINFSILTSRDIETCLNQPFNLRYLSQFQVHRARLPTSVFKDIISDMDLLMRQFAGPMWLSTYVEERARSIAPIFNRIAGQFNSHIANSLESVMTSFLKEGIVKDRDRLVSRFKAFGIIVLVVIEIRTMPIGDAYYDCLAHLFAECDACDCENLYSGIFHRPSIPIHAILTDGQQFVFFRFDASTQPPVLQQGTLRSVSPAGLSSTYDGSLDVMLHLDRIGYLCSFRPICETVFYIVQLGFLRGMQLHYFQHMMITLRDGGTMADFRKDRERNAWRDADDVARDALDLGVQAAVEARGGGEDADEDARVAAANDKARRAWDMIQESIDALPANYKKPERKYSIMCDWDERRVDRA
ncbi:hypothetical protein Hypma_004191 [Hypsizygus marmoreus]|uniref:Uncharacterized protein n=1 Tax=Hypsizygus marmoreus TaxID=39966 RepID=A0A369J083_HYPMA|nr:hypothetical protein Hypma_004191 [Hypsizygus marmoreus]